MFRNNLLSWQHISICSSRWTGKVNPRSPDATMFLRRSCWVSWFVSGLHHPSIVLFHSLVKQCYQVWKKHILGIVLYEITLVIIALRLFACWSGFFGHPAWIRNLILSSFKKYDKISVMLLYYRNLIKSLDLNTQYCASESGCIHYDNSL